MKGSEMVQIAWQFLASYTAIDSWTLHFWEINCLTLAVRAAIHGIYAQNTVPWGSLRVTDDNFTGFGAQLQGNFTANFTENSKNF